MAIIKMQKVKAGKPYGLKAVLDYVQNLDKTDNGHLISAKDCLQECAYKQMHLVKQDYKQLHGRQYVHIIQSFSLSDDLSFDTAHEIGQKLLESFHGFQGVVATHTDRQHIHNHIVLNAVNFESGLKWQQSKRDLQNLKDLSDQLCKEHGLSVIEKGGGWQSYGENQANKGIGSWKQQLANVVATSVKKSNTREELIHYLNDKGIEVEFRKDDILFSLDNGMKCCGNTLISYGDYSKENLNNHFQYNNLLFMEAENNPMMMYQAVGLASDLLGREDRSELGNKYLHGKQLSALEGEALKEAISELMKGGGYKGNTSHQNNKGKTQVKNIVNKIMKSVHVYKILKNIRVGRKIAIGYGFMTIIIILIAVTSIRNFKQISEHNILLGNIVTINEKMQEARIAMESYKLDKSDESSNIVFEYLDDAIQLVNTTKKMMNSPSN